METIAAIATAQSPSAIGIVLVGAVLSIGIGVL